MKQEKKIIGSWLHSKQKTTSSLDLLKKYAEVYKNVNALLRSKVAQHVKNNRTKIGKVLYKTKDCYKDDMEFQEFTKSIIEIADAKLLKELIEKSIDIILKKDSSLKKKFSREEVRNVIKMYIFYQPYVGYAFEQRIRDLIKEHTNFKIHTSRSLDQEYAIDMQLSDYEKQKVLGLQLKSCTFMNLSVDKREDYYRRNRQAKNWFNYEVYYVFHDNDCNIMCCNYDATLHYEEACKSVDNFIVVANEEEFIKDLLAKI